VSGPIKETDVGAELLKPMARSMEHFGTESLTAEKLRENHLADLVALHLDPEVSRYLGGVRSAEATKTYLAVNMAHWDQHGFGLFVLRTKDGTFAGRAGGHQAHHRG
jgi:hypothetical protein